MEMKLVLDIDGERHPVTVSADGHLYTLEFEDRQVTVDMRRIHETDSMSFIVGSESVEAWTVPRESGYDVSVLGASVAVDVEDALRAGLKELSAGAAATEEVIRAPMPGVVVELKAEPGQFIDAGDAVVIVEAMKMRNEFGPKSSGILTDISVAEGDSVERGQPLCTIRKPETTMAKIKGIAHVAIASRDLADGVRVFVDALGLDDDGRERLDDRQLDVAFVRAGDVHLELLESLAPDTPIATFIEKNGPGLHHICFDVEGIDDMVDRCRERGLVVIGDEITIGAHDRRVAFLHPKSTGGVLIELSEAAPEPTS